MPLSSADPEVAPYAKHARVRASTPPIVWIFDLVALIARRLEPNFVACTLRLVNAATAAQFRDSNTVRLSQHVPAHAFAHRFSAPAELRSLSRLQRLKLVHHTARSGSLTNLKLILEVLVRHLTGEGVEADAPGAQLWRTLQAGGVRTQDLESLVNTTATAGHAHICQWLLESGCPVDRFAAACGAARGGHEALMEELLQRRPFLWGSEAATLTEAVAQGCSLESLQRHYRNGIEGAAGAIEKKKESIVAAAAASPTPDWRAKVEWLEAQGHAPSYEACEKIGAACLPDAVERLAWLRGRGYPVPAARLLIMAAESGSIPVLKYGMDKLPGRLAEATARLGSLLAHGGHLTALQFLHARGCLRYPLCALNHALGRGRLAVVAWLVDTFQIKLPALQALSRDAVLSQELALVRWMVGRGAFEVWQWFISCAVAGDCSEAMVELLAGLGCPVQLNDNAVRGLGMSGSLSMLRCLHELGWKPQSEDLRAILAFSSSRPDNLPLLRWLREMGCPDLQRPTAAVFKRWIRQRRGVSSLKWLVEEAGCRVNWRTAKRVARHAEKTLYCLPDGVTGWIREQLRQQLQREAQAAPMTRSRAKALSCEGR